MQPIKVSIAGTEQPIKSREVLLGINKRTLIGRAQGGYPKYRIKQKINCPRGHDLVIRIKCIHPI